MNYEDDREVICAVIVRRDDDTATIEMVVPRDDDGTIGYSFGQMVRHAAIVLNALNRQRRNEARKSALAWPREIN